MAPLFLSVAQLQRTFCPLSTRASHLPGSQARTVPCNRLCKAISRQQVVVHAAAQVMANGSEDTTSNGVSGVEHDRLAGASPATKAVHGGERAGRPRVSGAWWYARSPGSRCMLLPWRRRWRPASCLLPLSSLSRTD